jgi:hypothetical protein
MNQPGVGHEPSGEIIDRLVTFHRLGKPLATIRLGDFLGDAALVGGLERNTVGGELVEVVRNVRRVDRGIEIGEIPFRQLA